MVTKNDVFQMLQDFGVRRDDKLTMHISLKAVGDIENGAEGLLDALREYLCDGLLIIPTHTWAGIAERLYYDPKETVPCIGTLPRIAAFHPEAVRSLHPTHSVAVFGKEAAAYVEKEHTYTTPTPADNCLSRLYDERGKILLVGVGFESNTYIHTVEEQLDVPNRIGEELFPVRIKDYMGKIHTVNLQAHYVEGVPYGISQHYPVLEKPFFHMGALRYGKLGNAKVICCDAYQTTKAYERLLQRAQYDLCIDNKEIPEEYYKDGCR